MRQVGKGSGSDLGEGLGYTLKNPRGSRWGMSVGCYSTQIRLAIGQFFDYLLQQFEESRHFAEQKHLDRLVEVPKTVTAN